MKRCNLLTSEAIREAIRDNQTVIALKNGYRYHVTTACSPISFAYYQFTEPNTGIVVFGTPFDDFLDEYEVFVEIEEPQDEPLRNITELEKRLAELITTCPDEATRPKRMQIRVEGIRQNLAYWYNKLYNV